MRTGLKVALFIVLVYLSSQDWFKTAVQDLILKFKDSYIDVYLSRFLLIYIVFHFTPFKLLFPKWYRDKKPWLVYADKPDKQFTTALSEDDEGCVVFDPDNLGESSDLSEFLARYMSDDWKPNVVRKLKKTAWDWTSDEDEDVKCNEKKVVSFADMGYNTKSKTGGSSSEEDLPSTQIQARTQRRVVKVETFDKHINTETTERKDKATMTDLKVVKVSVACMTDPVVVEMKTASHRQDCIANTASIQGKLTVPKILERTDIDNQVGHALANLKLHNLSIKGKKKYNGFYHNRAMNYGIAGVGIGIVGYFVFKAFSR